MLGSLRPGEARLLARAWLDLPFGLRAVRRMERIIRQERIDLVHMNDSLELHKAGIIACRLASYGNYQDRAWPHLPEIGIRNIEMPAPSPDELASVKERLAAHGLTATSLQGKTDITQPNAAESMKPQFEACAALGAGVRDVGVGDLVYGLNDWYRDGASAEYCVARVADIAHKPAGVDHVHAAATPISALTAWQGLVERAGLAAGQRVLIHGAAGGVGTFAVQLARWRGARVIGTASAANLDFVRSLGADEVIDYRAERFEDVARDVDVVFDTVGGETLERSWGVLKPGGRLVTIAASGEQTTDERVRAAFFIVEPSRTQLAEIARLIDAGALRPVVGVVFPLAEARQAYQHKPSHGKVVLRVVDGGVAT